MIGHEFDTRDKRKAVADAEWRISAQLVRIGPRPEDDVVLEETTVPLRITDARLNSEPFDTGYAVVKWCDDKVQARSRRETAQKKARKK